MAAFPAMPLFTDAYLADTRHLTTEEHGAYLLLLMCAWRSKGCVLADDDKALARITGLTPTRWRRVRPALEAFFDLSGGVWRQGKLSNVYEDVARRVSRNRVSGAKGGRALAAKKRSLAGKPVSEMPALCQAAKAKTKDIESSKPCGSAGATSGVPEEAAGADVEAWFASIRPVAGDVFMDANVVRAWIAEDVDLEATVLPTIAAVLARELSRTGKPPKRLAYYRDAVLEAAKLQGVRHIKPTAKKEFQIGNEAHWRQLLGDPKNRFRGDYMAQNWFISGDHPDFIERALGPNPRFSKNRFIPPAIYGEYARGWLWL